MHDDSRAAFLLKLHGQPYLTIPLSWWWWGLHGSSGLTMAMMTLKKNTNWGHSKWKYKGGSWTEQLMIRSNNWKILSYNNVTFSPPASTCYLFYSLPLSLCVCVCVCVCLEGRWKWSSRSITSMLWNKARQMIACVSDVMVPINLTKHTTIQRLLTCCIFIMYWGSRP